MLQGSTEQPCHERERAFWRDGTNCNGSANRGESGGDLETTSEIALRREATKADEDIEVRGKRPIPECLSDSPI